FSSARRAQFVHLYSDPIYRDYRSQEQRFVERHPLSEEAKSREPFHHFYRWLTLHNRGETPEERAGAIQSQISTLRFAIEDRLSNAALDPIDEEWHHFLDAFIEWMFTKVESQESTRAFLDNVAGLNHDCYRQAYLKNPKYYVMELYHLTTKHPLFKDEK